MIDASRPLSVLIVEDEVLLAAELSFIIGETGRSEVGQATTSQEAVDLARTHRPDLALVDVHLSDGPTGVEAARLIGEHRDGVVLFMTANVGRLPEDFAGGCGVVGKPYSGRAIRDALNFTEYCLRHDTAPGRPPAGLRLAPDFAARWSVDNLLQAS